jgi:hypothetical protein
MKPGFSRMTPGAAKHASMIRDDLAKRKSLETTGMQRNTNYE